MGSNGLATREWGVVGLLTAIGCALRLYQLGFNSIWLDEAYTISIAWMSLAAAWTLISTTDFMPPLFYWLEHYMLVLGDSEYIVRLLPAVFGTLTIPIIYLVGKEFADEFAGIIIAGAFTFSPFLIYYSQEARSYSMVLLFCAILMLAYLHAIKTNGYLSWFICSIIATLAFWTHFYSFVFIAPLVIFAIYKNRSDIIPLIMPIILWVGLTSPLLVGIYNLILIRTSSNTFGNRGIDVILQFFAQMSGFSNYAMLVFLFLFGFGMVWIWEKDNEKALILVWLIVSAFGISMFLAPIMPMQPRYYIFLTIPFFLGVSLSYRAIMDVIPKTKEYGPACVAIGLVLCLALAGLPFYFDYYQNYTKEDWRGFSADLTGITKSGDFVILVPGYLESPFNYYYSNLTDNTIELGAITPAELIKIQNSSGTQNVYYIVTSDINSANPSGESVLWLQNNTELIQKAWSGIFLYRQAPEIGEID